MVSRKLLTLMIFVALVVFAVVAIAVHVRVARAPSPGAGPAGAQIRHLFPCVCYPGEASGAWAVAEMAKLSNTVALVRLESFEFGGFETPDIEWTAVFRAVRILKGEGGPVYRLPIASPERNFGPGADGRLFLLFLRRSGERLLWALEPWLPESEAIAAGQ